MSYLPKPDSLAGRVCAYFYRHPDEELSTADITVKFDADSNSVSALLAGTVANGLLTLIKKGGAMVIYSAGPKLAEAMSAPPPKAPAPPRPPAQALPAPETLKVETDIPIPPAQGRLSAENLAYRKFFDTLQKGQSFTVAADVSKRLHNLANHWGKTFKARRRFAMRRVDATTYRIWRTE